MSPRSDASALGLLLEELAGRLGRGSAVDDAVADTLELYAGTLRQIADAFDTQARRARGEAAQHGADEELLGPLVRRLEAARARLVQDRHVLESPPARGRPLTHPGSDMVERFLEKHPTAGRPAICAATRISEWRIRCYIEARVSQAGGLEGEVEQLAGETPSRGRGRS